VHRDIWGTVTATGCHKVRPWGGVRGFAPLTTATEPLPVAEPASRQAPHAQRQGKGGGGGPPPSQEGPLLARAQPEVRNSETSSECRSRPSQLHWPNHNNSAESTWVHIRSTAQTSNKHTTAATPQRKGAHPPPCPATLPCWPAGGQQGISKPPPRPLRRVERSSAISSEKDSEGSFGETGGHRKSNKCVIQCNFSVTSCILHLRARQPFCWLSNPTKDVLGGCRRAATNSKRSSGPLPPVCRNRVQKARESQGQRYVCCRAVSNAVEA
jgi:hypothetical protein